MPISRALITMEQKATYEARWPGRTCWAEYDVMMWSVEDERAYNDARRRLDERWKAHLDGRTGPSAPIASDWEAALLAAGDPDMVQLVDAIGNRTDDESQHMARFQIAEARRLRRQRSRMDDIVAIATMTDREWVVWRAEWERAGEAAAWETAAWARRQGRE